MASRWIERLLSRLPLRWVFEVFYLSSSDPWQYWRSAFEKRRYDAAVDLLERYAPRAPRVLEVGCSVGAFTRRLLDLGPRRVVGVDISAVALRRAQAALASDVDAGRAMFVCADLFREGPPDGPFEVIVAMDVLGYTDDLQILATAAARLRSRLAPGGLMLVGNTKLRAHDGEGFEPFASGFPRRGAGDILACVQNGMRRLDGVEDRDWRIDVLACEQQQEIRVETGKLPSI